MKGPKEKPEADDWMSRTQTVADNIRLRGFEYVMRANGGYLSQICSAAEILAFLYTRALKLEPAGSPISPGPFTGVPAAGRSYSSGSIYNGAKAPHLDRFFFSPAHYALPLYVALIEVGRMTADGLAEFKKDGSTVELIGAEHSPGFESTTGSLAQALSQAGGVALARRMKGDTGLTWVMMSDGEFQEGQTWEAFQALSFHKLDSIRVIVDVNKQQCDGPMDSVMTIDPLGDRLRAFGAHVVEVDAHDLAAMDAALDQAQPGKPLVILANSNPSMGIPLLEERRPILHYLRFSSDEERQKYAAAFQAMKEASSCWKS